MSEFLLGVGASAACYKAVALASGLVRRGHGVTAVLTPAATRLVAPLQFAAVTGRRALHDEWSPADPAGMDHIALARRADALLIVPATADLIGQLAQGLAPNLLLSLALALDAGKPCLFAPAMNPQMWAHPAVRRNVAQLEDDGWIRVGPVSGPTACGEDGEGRMCEPDAIVAAAVEAVASA
ncbi:MAG TPA: flavoprotein [Planctomycetota bacterium]